MVKRPRSNTLGDLIDELAEIFPTSPAIIWKKDVINFYALKNQINVFASGLLALGIKPGDRIALLCTNRPEWIIAAFAIAKIGCITIAVSTFSTAREFKWVLNHSEASALISISEFRGRKFSEYIIDLFPELLTHEPGNPFGKQLPSLRSVISIDSQTSGAIVHWDDCKNLAAENPTQELYNYQKKINPDDICFILYTSGSTAAPKGVTLAHENVIINGYNIGERQHLLPSDRLWFSVPLFWSFGSANALPAIMTHGGCVVLQEIFEPGAALDLIDRERCTVFYGMTNMARAMKEHPDWSKSKVKSIRTGLTIGLPEDVRFTMEALTAPELCNVYGSTETYGNAAVCDAKDPLDLRLHSQGLPLPGMRIRTGDPITKLPLKDGQIGELAVAGRVTPGYFKDPVLTARSFDSEGFFLTGDLGVIKPDGRVYFRGRLKEIIKTGGVNVAPQEVEEVLLKHSAVKQAFVVGIPDPIKDESVAAVVELNDKVEIMPSSLVDYCKIQLAAYKVPKFILFLSLDQLPLTATGKIHRPGIKNKIIKHLNFKAQTE